MQFIQNNYSFFGVIYHCNYTAKGVLYNHQEKQNKKPEPQSLDSTHGTGTNQKNERMLYIIAKVKQNEKN